MTKNFFFTTPGPSADPSMAFGWELAQQCAFDDIAAEEARVQADPRPDSSSRRVCVGAFAHWAALCDGFRGGGVTFSVDPPTRAAVLHFSTLGSTELMTAGVALTKAIKALRAAGYSWHKPQAQSDPKPAPPQEIKIISMPARTTETTVRRDADGDLAGSTAVESDRTK